MGGVCLGYIGISNEVTDLRSMPPLGPFRKKLSLLENTFDFFDVFNQKSKRGWVGKTDFFINAKIHSVSSVIFKIFILLNSCLRLRLRFDF